MFNKEGVEKIYKWLVDVRRDFHMFPELGKNEFRTAEKIKEYLKEMRIPYRDNIAGTGIIAEIEGEDSSYRIAFRGDMDALPIVDLKNVDYASKNLGICHACGHDSHMTMTLGIGRYFYINEKKPPCNIRLIFQPAEETIGGAKDMILEGALKDVDAIYSIHVSDEYNVGEIGIKYGTMNASSDTLNIKIKGKSSHGAYPSGGIDAILIASHVIVALQSVVSRNIDARDGAVVTIGVIKGGTQGNIIADTVELKGTLRTLNPDVRKKALERIEEIVNNIPKSFGGTGEFMREEGYTSLINHDKSVDIIKKCGEEILGKEKIKEKKVPNMGVEDFAYFVEKVPGAMFNVGIRNEERNIIGPAHNGIYDIDEKGLLIGTEMNISIIYEEYEGRKK